MKRPAHIPISRILLLLMAMSPAVRAEKIPLLTEEGYPVPQPGAELSFPLDHGNHPAFKIEWWYLTGHLVASSGERFGYQATFFRNALKAGGQSGEEPFGTGQLYLTHMALTDETGAAFHFEQRLARDGWDAYSATGRLDVRNGPWRLKMTDPATAKMQLEASVRSDVQWSLELVPAKPLVRFGEDGTSRKGPAPEARSYYLTWSKLETTGTVRLGDKEYTVTGSSWMDHEIASSQLDPSYTGWDWIAIQLDDGWEIKAYLLRKADGSSSPFSALYWIDPEGQTYYRDHKGFSWDKSATWRSPETNAAYPNAPVIETTHPENGETVVFRFEPILDNQELVFSGATYWEGAGRILDATGKVTGSAYLELVGYAGQIEGLR